MAVPWIQVYSNLTSHPKTDALAEALGLPDSPVSGTFTASGMLVGLWSWAAMNATDGDLRRCTPRSIAKAAGWQGEPEAFLSALIATGWVDAGEDTGRRLHDWEDYASLLIESEENRKKGTRERVKRYRERKEVKPEKPCNVTVTEEKSEIEETCNDACNVTVTLCNAPTIPNLTVPNQETDGVNARVREAAEFWERIIGKPLPSALSQELEMRLSAGSDMELIREALRLSTRTRRPAAYFAKLLQNWTAEKITSYSDYCARGYHRDGPENAPPAARREKSFAEIAAEMEDTT